MDTGWFKSSGSSGGSDNCVEVRLSSGADVRDSQERTGPMFAFPSSAWRAFLSPAKSGRFDLPR